MKVPPARHPLRQRRQPRRLVPIAAVLLAAVWPLAAPAQTIAFWPFDEPKGLYPSCVLDDVSDSNFPLVIGPGGQIVEGKFGNALEPLARPQVQLPAFGSVLFGLAPPPPQTGRVAPPLTWANAMFCALMTRGENHLRKEVSFADATATRLNLGDFDWTVEFWYLATRRPEADGVVFEVGRGPRGENDEITRLSLAADNRTFLLVNKPGGVMLAVPTDAVALDPDAHGWHHLAFVYTRAESQLRHFVDGRLQPLPEKATIRPLAAGGESYLTLGRDGLWKRPLPGRIDEMRFSLGALYRQPFQPPSSFLAPPHGAAPAPRRGEPLLFGSGAGTKSPLNLGDRKYLFIDDAIAQRMENVSFTVNVPRLAECVVDNIQGAFRKHLNVLEDEAGLLRMYFGVDNDHLAVLTSRDGTHWDRPVLRPGASPGLENVVIPEPTAMGMVFIDPNAPADERWKFLSGYEGRGVYLYSSPDGWSFKRHRTAAIPLRSGSQSNIFYDDQRALYVSYQRSDFARTHDGKTQREFVLVETPDLRPPWPFTPISAEDTRKKSGEKRLNPLIPWYLDNGPLTPGGFSVEYPSVFAPDDAIDPRGTDIYVPKAIKYPWAPDTYFAFPLVYFHYEDEGPPSRRVLGEKSRGLGSGPIEAQLAVSRDGLKWKRYPRPAYVGTGLHRGDRINQVYLAQGMVRRGDEIWQYYFGEQAYHSSWKQNTKRAVYRVVQRLDGFVSADAPYDRDATIVTKPLTFAGNRLVINIDTDAAGYAQIGILDGSGNAVEGFDVDSCIYINGDFVQTEVEWLGRGKDVSALAGKPVQIIIRMRGAKLYAMQFER